MDTSTSQNPCLPILARALHLMRARAAPQKKPFAKNPQRSAEAQGLGWCAHHEQFAQRLMMIMLESMYPGGLI